MNIARNTREVLQSCMKLRGERDVVKGRKAKVETYNSPPPSERVRDIYDVHQTDISEGMGFGT